MVTCIIGRSASGKTTLINKLMREFPKASFYQTDDYIPYGFENSIHVLMEKLLLDSNPDKFIEGVQVPRLLRKGLKLGCFRADKVIICQAPDEVRYQRHQARGSSTESFKRRDGFDRGVENVFKEYLYSETNKPVIEYYNT